MATVGVFGDQLAFSVSSDSILTFQDFTRDVSGRYGSHEVIGAKPRPEFLGAALQTISFSMHFYMGLGVDPRTMMDKVAQLVESGYHGALVIGNQSVGSNEWVITKSSETWKYVTNKGEVLDAVVSVTMQEYR